MLNFSRYTVTNSLIYDPSPVELEYPNSRARDVAVIPHDQMQIFIKKYTYELFTLPFIEFLKTLISKGADPH